LVGGSRRSARIVSGLTRLCRLEMIDGKVSMMSVGESGRARAEPGFHSIDMVSCIL
jgi:hypothetical protein